MSAALSQETRRGSHFGRRASRKVRRLYILVMGLTGVGKSTFISVITQNNDIPIGQPGGRQNVQDYVLLYPQGDIIYEVHFIDSPGFDDGNLRDTEVLSKIATFVNTNHKLKQRLAGILYLYDISQTEMGHVVQRNLRLLEEMIGTKEWNNCALVTTKWGCSNFEDDEKREESLMQDNHLFGAMLQSAHKPRTVRFHPKSQAQALDIIRPFLNNKFVPLLSEEMVGPRRLSLGETSAGKVIADGLQELAAANEKLAEVTAAREILRQNFDEQLFEEFNNRRKKLQRKVALRKTGRWVIRTTILGGALAFTVLTVGPGASAFMLEPAYEKVARKQEKSEEEARKQLEDEFKEKSDHGSKLNGKRSDWLWDRHVVTLHDNEQDSHNLAGTTVSVVDPEQMQSGQESMVMEDYLAGVSSDTSTDVDEGVVNKS